MATDKGSVIAAARNGDAEALEKLLGDGFNPSGVDEVC